MGCERQERVRQCDLDCLLLKPTVVRSVRVFFIECQVLHLVAVTLFGYDDAAKYLIAHSR
jgi:hypothetical protein